MKKKIELPAELPADPFERLAAILRAAKAADITIDPIEAALLDAGIDAALVIAKSFVRACDAIVRFEHNHSPL